MFETGKYCHQALVVILFPTSLLFVFIVTETSISKEEAVSTSSNSSCVAIKERCLESQPTNETPKQYKSMKHDLHAVERDRLLVTDTHQ